MKIKAQGHTLMLPSGDSLNDPTAALEALPIGQLGDLVEVMNILDAGVYHATGTVDGSPNGIVLNPGESAILACVGAAAWATASKPTGGLAGGAPVDAVASAATLDSEGANADLTVTAKTKGDLDPPITVTLHNAGVTALLTCSVVGRDILVGLANTDGTITSTANAVKAKIDGTPAAAALVTVAVEGSGAGTVDAITETELTGGVDGTPGVPGQLLVFDGVVYVCIAPATSETTGAWLVVNTSALGA